MNKLISLFTLFALVMMAGCEKSPKKLSDLKDGSAADSMMFYFGEMQAVNYWQDAESDTTMRTEEARKEFMEGFRAGLKMENDNSSYNKGLQLGLRLALRLREFHSRYGVEFSESVLASSLENALRSDSGIDIAAAQKGFYMIKDRMELKASKNELKVAVENLKKGARELGYTALSDTLYTKEIVPGSGPKFKMGDRLSVEVSVSTIDGKEVVTRQFPDSVTVGEGRVPLIVRQAVLTMNSGQTSSFMTTARTLLGKRYAVYKLPFDEPLIFTVKADKGIVAAPANSITQPTEE